MTSDTPVWGPDREDLNDLCTLMDSFDSRHDTMKVCWVILQNEKSTVTQLKKTLRIIDHVMNSGTLGGITKVRANVLEHVKVFTPLKTYKITRQNGAEIGTTVRELAVKIEANILGKGPSQPVVAKITHIVGESPADTIIKKEGGEGGVVVVVGTTPMMVQVEEEARGAGDVLFDPEFFQSSKNLHPQPLDIPTKPLTFDDFFDPKVDVTDHDFASLRRPKKSDEFVLIKPTIKQ